MSIINSKTGAEYFTFFHNKELGFGTVVNYLAKDKMNYEPMSILWVFTLSVVNMDDHIRYAETVYRCILF